MFNKNTILIFCIVFLFSFVIAIDYYPSGNNMNVTIPCDKINCSDGDINITLINPDNSILVDNQIAKKFNGYISYQTNLSTDGAYSYFLSSNNDHFSSSFIVTESGVEFNEGNSLLAICLFWFLVLSLFFSLYVIINTESYLIKFALYWIIHVLLIIISFVGWQFGVEGLLSSLALTGIFRMMFWILTIAVLPMIILSGAWIFYIHAFNEHFEKLIDKGVSTEEAFRMTEKRKGWLHGK